MVYPGSAQCRQFKEMFGIRHCESEVRSNPFILAMQNKQNITVNIKCSPCGTWRAGNRSFRKLKHTVNKVSSLRDLAEMEPHSDRRF